jgi:hypothetical protein
MERYARKILFEGGKKTGLMPTWVLRDAGGNLTIVATPWGDDTEKKLFKLVVRRLMQKHKTVVYGFLTEAWMATTSKAEEEFGKDFVPPSERPDRVEVLIALVADRTRTEWASWLMVRDETERLVSLEPRDFPGADGPKPVSWMADLLKSVPAYEN